MQRNLILLVFMEQQKRQHNDDNGDVGHDGDYSNSDDYDQPDKKIGDDGVFIPSTSPLCHIGISFLCSYYLKHNNRNGTDVELQKSTENTNDHLLLKKVSIIQITIGK